MNKSNLAKALSKELDLPLRKAEEIGNSVEFGDIDPISRNSDFSEFGDIDPISQHKMS